MHPVPRGSAVHIVEGDADDEVDQSRQPDHLMIDFVDLVVE
jgi:hypothetical protein